MARRLNVTLDDERAAKLARLAERMHVHEGTLARSLLATALQSVIMPATGHFLAEESPEELLATLTESLAPYRPGTATATLATA